MQKPAVTLMVKAARAAGNVLLRHMNKLDALNVVEKDRMDYASDVDGLAEKEIIKEFRRATPDYAILGEESGPLGSSGNSRQPTWVIDPLDGTSNYLHGIPHFCVSIALVENGEPTHGVIFDPLRNELFTASRGSGATLNDKKIRIAERKDLARVERYQKVADRLIFDARAPRDATRPGGLGTPFDWALLKGVNPGIPYMLSGGLDAGNVAEALRITRAPGVDVSSGVERAPGEKDPDKIRAFIRAARAAEAALTKVTA